VSAPLGVIALIAGVVICVWSADLLVDGLLGTGRKLGIAPFALTVVLSGMETENLAAGIATNAKGLPGAAAGTFLGGATFLALGVAGLGGLIAPMKAALPTRFAILTAIAPLPLLGVAIDGRISRPEGAALIAWFLVSLVALARTGPELLAGDDELTRRPVAKLLIGLGVLTGGGWLLGAGLRTTVRHLGISATLLGNTAVAATVEAEELARVATPARRGRPDLALGSLAGTIVHFTTLNAGVIAVVKPLTLGHPTVAFFLPVAAASPAIFAALLLWRGQIGRIEGAGLVLLYLAYLVIAVVIAS
jgi:cation:H+ antiporter